MWSSFPGVDPALSYACLGSCKLVSCPLQVGLAIAGARVCYRQKSQPEVPSQEGRRRPHLGPQQSAWLL